MEYDEIKNQVHLYLDHLKKGVEKGLIDTSQEFENELYTFLEEAREITNLIYEKYKNEIEKEKEEVKKPTVIKPQPLPQKEVLVRYVDEVILTKLINNFIGIKNIKSEVSVKDTKLNINFMYNGVDNLKSIIDAIERLKLINWQIFAGQVKFSKVENVKTSNIVANFNTDKDNEIFKDWAKEQLLNIIQYKYPNNKIEIRFLFEA